MLQFGRYQVLGKLSEGGMGLVYRGVAHGADGFEKPVVIKRIRGQLARDPEMTFRFVNEAKLTMTMSHGNLVQVLDLGKLEDEYFMVLEFVDGRDLRTVLKRCQARGEPIGQPLALHIICQVLRGLDYAHRRVDSAGRPLGIVHRDVKPGNILCSFEGEVKLTDFGVATAMAGLRVTAHGMVVGSLAYMSPEQVRGEPLDRRSDIFSVGVILYQLLCGAHPFPGTGIEEVGRALQHGRFLAPAAHGVELSTGLEQALVRSLERKVEDRYPTAEAMLVDLERCQAGVAGTEPQRGPATASDLRAFMRRLFEEELRRPAVVAETGDALVGLDLEVKAEPVPETMVSAYALSRRKSPLRELPTVSAAVEADPTRETVLPGRRPTGPFQPDRSGSLTAVSHGEQRTAGLVPRRWGMLTFAGAVLLALLGSASFLALRSLRGERGGAAARPAADAPRPPGPDAAPGRDDARAPAPDRGQDARAALPDTAERRVRPHQRTPPRRESGWVQVSTQPAYAEVYLGKQRLDVTPCRVRLPAGSHLLRLVNRKLGLEVRRRVTVRSGAEARLVLDHFE